MILNSKASVWASKKEVHPEKEDKNDRKNLTVSRYPFKLNIEPILVCINRNI